MKTLRVLYVTADLAPVTGSGDLGRASAGLTRALAACPIDLTVVVPRTADRDPEELGYARRLEPIEASAALGEVTLFEGQLASGGGRVFLLDTQRQDQALLAGLDLLRARGLWPDLIHVGHGAEQAAAGLADLVRGDLAEPAVVFSRDLSIPPGIDDSRWRAPRDVVAGKAPAKLELQREWGLPPRARTPLISAVGPFDDAIVSDAAAGGLASLDVQVALLADPDADGDRLPRLRDLASRNPTRVAARMADSDGCVRALLTAADLALLPRDPDDRFPSDLYCMRFGTAPIAPHAGSYERLLVDFDQRTATGNAFLFDLEDGSACVAAARRASRAYRDASAFEILARRLAAADVSWETAALEHLDQYRRAIAAA